VRTIRRGPDGFGFWPITSAPAGAAH
jgi:hypothetical protein